MAFPTVVAETGGFDAVNALNHTINLPNGSNVVGRRLVVMFNCDGTVVVTFPAGWTVLATATVAGQTNVSVYHDVDGTEGYPAVGATITVATSAAEQQAHVSYLISGHNPSVPPSAAAYVTASDANPNPPSLTPPWGAKDTLWIAVAGVNNAGGASPVTAYPANYTNGVTFDSGTGAAGGSIGVARRNNAVATEDPGTFTIGAAAQWYATTIAIRPLVNLVQPYRTSPSGTQIGDNAQALVGVGYLDVTGLGFVFPLVLASGGVASTNQILSVGYNNFAIYIVFAGGGGTTTFEYQILEPLTLDVLVTRTISAAVAPGTQYLTFGASSASAAASTRGDPWHTFQIRITANAATQTYSDLRLWASVR